MAEAVIHGRPRGYEASGHREQEAMRELKAHRNVKSVHECIVHFDSQK
jgi:hypothetical protein